MNILQLNIRSLLAHQHELKVLLQHLCNKNSAIDVVALSETFLTKKVEKLVNISRYILHSNCHSEYKGSGVCLLIKKGIHYQPRRDLEEFIEKELEHIFIEIISKCGKKIIMGSSYRAPNTIPSKFTDHVKKVISKVQSERDEKELILCMDQNLDLLKCHLHEPTRAFLDNLVEKGVFPTITCPTRITQTSATLIDNTFVSSKLHRSFDLGILLSDISDHLPSLVLLKQTKLLNKEPLEFTSRNPNGQKLKLINEKLHDIDWNGNLTSSDVNLNFDYLSNSIDRVMDEIAPRCTVKISAKRRFVEPWMSTSLEQSANKKNLLYKKMLQENSTPADVKNYKTYRNTYNRIKRHAQETYYQKKALDFNNNTKQLWNLINKVIRKKGHSGSIIPYITVDGIKITDPNEIADSFGQFYSTLGSSLAQKNPR